MADTMHYITPEPRFTVEYLDDRALRGSVKFFNDRGGNKWHIIDVYGYFMRKIMGPIELLKYNLKDHYNMMEAREKRNAIRTDDWCKERVDFYSLKPYATFTDLIFDPEESDQKLVEQLHPAIRELREFLILLHELPNFEADYEKGPE